jgi:hypothetical protein
MAGLFDSFPNIFGQKNATVISQQQYSEIIV